MARQCDFFRPMKKFMGFVALVFLFGCATASHVVTGKIHPEITPDSVKVYSEMPAGAEKIAIVNATANNLKINSCVEALKRDAAKLGANGLVITESEAHYFQGARVSGQAIFVP
jgi:hypothetical protein